MKFAFKTDPDTTKLFEIVVEALKQYFGHSEAAAVGLINDYYLHSAFRLRTTGIITPARTGQPPESITLSFLMGTQRA